MCTIGPYREKSDYLHSLFAKKIKEKIKYSTKLPNISQILFSSIAIILTVFALQKI